MTGRPLRVLRDFAAGVRDFCVLAKRASGPSLRYGNRSDIPATDSIAARPALRQRPCSKETSPCTPTARPGSIPSPRLTPRPPKPGFAASCPKVSYEWGVHVTFFGGRVGFGEAEIRDICRDDPAATAFSDRAKLLLAMCDEPHATSTVSGDLWKKLEREYTAEQLIELVVLAGLYHVISFATNAFALAPEAFGARFPVEWGSGKTKTAPAFPGRRAGRPGGCGDPVATPHHRDALLVTGPRTERQHEEPHPAVLPGGALRQRMCMGSGKSRATYNSWLMKTTGARRTSTRRAGGRKAFLARGRGEGGEQARAQVID